MKPSEMFVKTLIKNSGWENFYEVLKSWEMEQSRKTGSKNNLKKTVAKMRKALRKTSRQGEIK